MSTTKAVRAYINSLPEGDLFTSIELRKLWSGTAVDQCLHRMVDNGEITRWARGVFSRKDGNRIPSIEEVAIIKARSFGKEIAAADTFDSTGRDKSENFHSYLANGRSSSFVLQGKFRIYMHCKSEGESTRESN